MEVIGQQHRFRDPHKHIGFHDEFERQITVDAHVVIHADAFVELQKDLFTEFFAWIKDTLATATLDDLDEFKFSFEKKLQTINTKLRLIADKAPTKGPFYITGIIQIFYDHTYIASMIGDIGIAVFRKKKLNALLHNDIDPKRGIDTFSEYIEGIIEHHDKLLICGGDIRNYIAKEELKDILDVSYTDQTSFMELVQSLLEQRTDTELFGFIEECHISLPTTNDAGRAKLASSLRGNKRQQAITSWIIKHKYIAVMGLAALFVGYFVWAIVTNILKDDEIQVTTETGATQTINIEKLGQRVANFEEQAAGMDSAARTTEYEQIIELVNQYAEQTPDAIDAVEAIKQTITTTYYTSEGIIYLDSPRDAYTNLQFDDSQRDTIGSGVSLIDTTPAGATDPRVWVVGSKGAITDATLSQQTTPDEVATLAGSPRAYDLSGNPTVTTCIPNAIESATMASATSSAICATDDNALALVTNNGASKFVLQSGELRPQTQGMGRFSNFFYQLSPAKLSQKAIIQKFVLSLGATPSLTANKTYELPADKIPASFSGGFSDMVIDKNGSFLMRAKEDAQLYQVYGTSAGYTVRNVSLSAPSTALPPFSKNIRIIAPLVREPGASSYDLYIADIDNNTLHVYTTSGADGGRGDTNRNSYSYTGTYKYSIAWDFDSATRDVIVQRLPDNSAKKLLILTDDGVVAYDWTALLTRLEKNN